MERGWKTGGPGQPHKPGHPYLSLPLECHCWNCQVGTTYSDYASPKEPGTPWVGSQTPAGQAIPAPLPQPLLQPPPPPSCPQHWSQDCRLMYAPGLGPALSYSWHIRTCPLLLRDPGASLLTPSSPAPITITITIPTTMTIVSITEASPKPGSSPQGALSLNRHPPPPLLAPPPWALGTPIKRNFAN